MQALVTQTRLLIGDPSGAGSVFNDDDLLALLDNNATDVLYEQLQPVPTIQPGGATEYLQWRAAAGWWEANEQLFDAGYNTLTAATVNRQRGIWTFDAHQPAVLIRGSRYDVYGAAADAVDVWLAKVKLEFDFAADGADYKRSQKLAGLVALRDSLRSRSGAGGVVTATQVRTDIWNR
jgi:hypothetical protein